MSAHLLSIAAAAAAALGSPSPLGSPLNPPSTAALGPPSVLLPGTAWRLRLDVGRHQNVGTWMPKDWAASQVRLGISGVDVLFTDELCQPDFSEPRLNGLGAQEQAYRVRVLSCGQQTDTEIEVATVDGAWSRVAKGNEYRLRFCLDFPDGASRGDVDLGESRVFFTSDGPLTSVSRASALGLKKSGQLNVKRVRSFLDALANIGRSPKMQWGEGMFTTGLFSMTPIVVEEELR